MGTTLQNGVYLPSEGERNCYAGLKTNWEILDQKVADVTALQQAVAGALHREIVENLPTTDIDPNTIYMILSGTSATENVYNEFMYVNNAWELIGTSATDLTNYYTKGDVDGLLLLKANASDLTSHTGDTTIHVTSADKSKWNTVALIKQLRLVNTQVGSATTIAFANIDDTNGIKVGDKCMDLDAKMFEITAVDTTNQTVTVGTALIDLAQDSDVVHKSGDETITGGKRFGVVQSFTGYPSIRLYSTNDDITVLPSSAQQRDIRFTDKNNAIIAYFIFQHRNDANEPFRTCWRQNRLDGTSNYYSVNFNNLGEFYPENANTINLGTPTCRWKGVYAVNYYYGSNNVEFSTKFVTTDTDQTVDGNKTFSKYITSDGSFTGDEYSSNARTNLWLLANRDTEDVSGVLFDTYRQNTAQGTGIHILGVSIKENNVRYEGCRWGWYWDNNLNGYSFDFKPTTQGANQAVKHNLGTSIDKWDTINGINPGALSMPDLSNGIDISSYIDVTQTSQYTAPADGYISICGYATSTNAILIKDHDYDFAMTFRALTTSLGATTYFVMPVIKNHVYDISCSAVTNIAYAKFYPCQGNV